MLAAIKVDLTRPPSQTHRASSDSKPPPTGPATAQSPSSPLKRMSQTEVMSPSIEQLLHRRSDLSTFLVHLTRDQDTGSARENLLSIASEFFVRGRTALGMAKHLDLYLRNHPKTSQRMACFTETPLEHAWMMTEPIAYRKVQFEPYGLVFTKTFARKRACNPVWYLDITPGHDWLTNPINQLIALSTAVAADGAGSHDPAKLQEMDIFELTPFIEQMGPMTEGGRKEFWWEREWRHRGDFWFGAHDVVAILAPEADHTEFRNDLGNLQRGWNERKVPILDPRWGLERMITAMADIDHADDGPFPT